METIPGCILSWAKEFVGQEEKPGNQGFKDEEFDQLMRELTTFRNGHAWCVYFCWLCWALSYNDFNEDFQEAKEEMTGGATRTFRHFKKLGWTSKTPSLGSIAIWQKFKNGVGQTQGHAAIVERWNDTHIWTVDGNTNTDGGREGYIVADNKRRGINFDATKGMVLIGFIHPKHNRNGKIT